MSDNVNSPKHYSSSGIEVIDLAEMIFQPEHMYVICLWSAFKYLCRYKMKNGKEDVEKAEWYLNRIEGYRSDGITDHLASVYLKLYSELKKAKKYTSGSVEQMSYMDAVIQNCLDDGK